MIKPIIDRLLAIAISKKLTVFFIGTLFLLLGKLDGESWISLSMVYIGGQSIIDSIIESKKNG